MMCEKQACQELIYEREINHTYFSDKILFFFSSKVKATRPHFIIIFNCHHCRKQDGQQKQN